MAKVRLTTKDILNMLSKIDYVEDAKGTGLTPEAFEKRMKAYETRLRENKQGEAVERQIIDEVTADLGNIFKKDIAAVNKRMVNSSFEAARTTSKLQRLRALRDVYQESHNKFEKGYKKQASNAKQEYATQNNIIEEAERNVKKANETISSIEEKIAYQQDLYESSTDDKGKLDERVYQEAVALDEQDYYLNNYGTAYINESTGRIQRLIKGYKLDSDGKLDVDSLKADAKEDLVKEIENFVKAKIEAHKQANAEGAYVESANSEEYQLFDSTSINWYTPENDRRSTLVYLPELISKSEDQLNTANKQKQSAERDLEDSKRVAERYEKIIRNYEAMQGKYNTSISSIMSKVTEAEEDKIAEMDYTRAQRIRVAEDILENELQEANPLLQMAYIGYIANLKEQARIASKFRVDPSNALKNLFKSAEEKEVAENLADVIANDFELSSEDCMEQALEHYISEGMGSGRYVGEPSKLKANAHKYFGKYIPNIDSRIKAIELKYKTAEESFEYFERDIVSKDYVGKIKTHEFDDAIEAELKKNAKALEARAAKTKNRLEILNPDYDRVAKFVNNPKVKDYMALTMLREELIAQKTKAEKKGEAFKDAYKLSEVSRRMENAIEAAKKSGLIIDIAYATQVAVETLIPNYDEVYEFAKIKGIDLTTEQGRRSIKGLENEFIARSVIANAQPQDVARIVDFLYQGKGNLQGEAREEFIAKNLNTIFQYLEEPKKLVVNPALKAYYDKFENNKYTQLTNEQLVDIFTTYEKSGIVLSLQEKDGKQQLMMALPEQDPVPVSRENIANKEFLMSVGIIFQMPYENALKNHKFAEQLTKNPIESFLKKRESLCYATKDGKDLGTLGQASMYVAGQADFDYATELNALREYYASPAVLTAFKKANPTIADPKQALRNEYMNKYLELKQHYAAAQQPLVEMSGKQDLATPASSRQNNDPRNRDHNEVYDKAEIKTVNKWKYELGLKKEINSFVAKKITAINNARIAFQEASVEEKELLDEGIAVAVIDTLQSLSRYEIKDEKQLDELNKAVGEIIASEIVAQEKREDAAEKVETESLDFEKMSNKQLGVYVKFGFDDNGPSPIPVLSGGMGSITEEIIPAAMEYLSRTDLDSICLKDLNGIDLEITKDSKLKDLTNTWTSEMQAKREAKIQEEYHIELGEDKKLSLSVGEKTFTVKEDGKVAIEQRESTKEAKQTVSEEAHK